MNRAANQVELAKHLGVTRKTIQRWLKIEGNPGRLLELEDWEKYAFEKGHESPNTKTCRPDLFQIIRLLLKLIGEMARNAHFDKKEIRNLLKKIVRLQSSNRRMSQCRKLFNARNWHLSNPERSRSNRLKNQDDAKQTRNLIQGLALISAVQPSKQ